MLLVVQSFELRLGNCWPMTLLITRLLAGVECFNKVLPSFVSVDVDDDVDDDEFEAVPAAVVDEEDAVDDGADDEQVGIDQLEKLGDCVLCCWWPLGDDDGEQLDEVSSKSEEDICCCCCC